MKYVLQCYKNPPNHPVWKKFKVGQYLNADGNPTSNIDKAWIFVSKTDADSYLGDEYNYFAVSDFLKKVQIKINVCVVK